jgi:hypothetical protein
MCVEAKLSGTKRGKLEQSTEASKPRDFACSIAAFD